MMYVSSGYFIQDVTTNKDETKTYLCTLCKALTKSMNMHLYYVHHFKIARYEMGMAEFEIYIATGTTWEWEIPQRVMRCEF